MTRGTAFAGRNEVGDHGSSAARIDWDAALHHAFELALCLLRARRGALYAVRGDALWLALSDRLDQTALTTADEAWSRTRNTLLAGAPVEGRGQPSYILLPCLAAAELRGVLYVETHRPGALGRPHLMTFTAVLGRALSAWLEPEPPGDEAEPARAQSTAPFEGPLSRDCPIESLVALLERNEWNVSLVARLLGVTRMTIYNRLRRAGIPRKRVRRSRRAARACALSEA
jgi:hypothetical protein